MVKKRRRWSAVLAMTLLFSSLSVQATEMIEESVDASVVEENVMEIEDDESDDVLGEVPAEMPVEEIIPNNSGGELQDENPYRLETLTGMDENGNIYEMEFEDGVIGSRGVSFFSRTTSPKVVNFRTQASGVVTNYTEYKTGISGYTYGPYGADAAYLGTYNGKVRFMLAGVVGEVAEADVEIVNVSDVYVISCYEVIDGRLIHHIAQNMKTPGYATNLDNGSAPSYLQTGVTYYSYDGHYFYTDYSVMLNDYINENRLNSVNPYEPYYNYYQSLPLRSQTVYDGDELSALINAKVVSSSKLLNTGHTFVQHQNTYGVNALLMAGVAANESGWGTSSICQQKNNIFGLNAVDSAPSSSAYPYASISECIAEFANGWMSRGYLYPGDWRYYGGFLGNKASGINLKYASDPYWGEKAANIAWNLDKNGGSLDYGQYVIGIKDTIATDHDYVYVRSQSNTASTKLYGIGRASNWSVLIKNSEKENSFYKIQSDGVINADRTAVTSSNGEYNFEQMYAYIHSDYVELANAKVTSNTTIARNTYRISNASNESLLMAVENNNVSNTAKIVSTTGETVNAFKQFDIVETGNGCYKIVSEASGKVWDIPNGSGATGIAIQQYEWNGTNAQLWSFENAGDGYFYIRSRKGTYLELQGNTIVTAKLDENNPAQKWKLTVDDCRVLEDGTYSFANAIDSSYAASVEQSSLNNLANVQLNKLNNSSAQRFEITYMGNGYYKIISENSGKALDVANASVDSGANVWQYEWNGSDAQLWKILDCGEGTYYIKSKLGTVLDIAGISVSDGKNIQMSQMGGTSSQKWLINCSDYQPVQDGVYVIANASSGVHVMTENNGNIQLGSFSNGTQQKYQVTYVGGGFYKILLQNTEKSLDVTGANKNNGANVGVTEWNGSDAQLWKFVDAGDGSYYIKSKLGTVLDVFSGLIASGTNIQTYTSNGTAAQKWKLDSVRASLVENPIPDGTYTIESSTDRRQVLDITWGSELNFANIQTYWENSTSAQKFEFTYLGNGYYKIISERTGKALDVANGSKNAGANVWQYEWNGTDAQLWSLQSAGDGTYYIISKLGTVLDLNVSSAVVSANVQTDNMKDEKSQRWHIVENSTKPFADGTYSFRMASSVNKVMDIECASMIDGARGQLYTYNDTLAQKFEVSHIDKGWYRITSKNSGKALEEKNGTVIQSEWAGNESQLWKIVSDDNGSYIIKAKSGKAIYPTAGTVNDWSILTTVSMNNLNAQKWVLRFEKDYDLVEVEEGTYNIETALQSNRLLNISHNSKVNGGNVNIYSRDYTLSQKFRIEKVSDGYYRIISVSSGKALDVASASMLAGANVWQYEWNGTNAQLWRFIDAGDGTYYIQSKMGTVLDVAGAGTDSGTNVWVYDKNNSLAQKWILRK